MERCIIGKLYMLIDRIINCTRFLVSFPIYFLYNEEMDINNYIKGKILVIYFIKLGNMHGMEMLFKVFWYTPTTDRVRRKLTSS